MHRVHMLAMQFFRPLLIGSLGLIASLSFADSQVSFSFDSQVAIQDAFFLFHYKAGSAFYGGHMSLGDVTAGQHTFNLTVTSPSPQFVLDTTSPYTVAGVSGGSVVIAMNADAAAAAVNKQWSGVFSLSESFVYTALTDPSSNYELNTVIQNDNSKYLALAQNVIPTGQLMKFSGGTNVGSVQVRAVPEPSTLLAFIPVAGLVARRRKKA